MDNHLIAATLGFALPFGIQALVSFYRSAAKRRARAQIAKSFYGYWAHIPRGVVDLKGVDLKGADLRGADLRGADLRKAD